MKSSLGDKMFYLGNYLLLTIVAASCLFPLLHIISISLSDSHSVMSGTVSFWPKGMTFDSYNSLFEGTRIVKSFQNSVLITVIGVVASLIMTITFAYPLSRPYFIGRKFWTLVAVFTMLFGGGLIPTYLVVKELGLINSYWAIWLPGIISTYLMLILRTYFESLPEEVVEAARMDGCSELGLLTRVILPLSMPALATLALFYGVTFWNAFLSVLLYINQTSKYNLTVLVQQLVQNQGEGQANLQSIVDTVSDGAAELTREGVVAAGIMVLILPMLIVYPFIQKHFVKGVTLGAIKG